MSTVVTRFAPSPTGNLHIGGLRTALFSYLYAKHHGGRTVLRIEDTDKERSKPEYEKNIIDGLKWLGLKFDEFYRQSERTDIYKTYLEKMVADGHAYVSKETPSGEDAAKQRSEVIRFKNPNTTITFPDIIRGDISFDTTELGDFVIAKSFSEPLYHLGVVIDDHEMGITHVIRGEDHISNTPRQILIGRAIGATQPVYGHLPLILAADRTKLSKRKGARALTEYEAMGILPEALINYTAFLGWNPGTEQEIFSLAELIAAFDTDRVQKAGAIYNEEKLRWINHEYLKKMPAPELHTRIAEKFAVAHRTPSLELIAALAPIVLDRIETFGDLDTLIADGEFEYFFTAPEYEAAALVWKESTPADALKHLTHATAALQTLSPSTAHSAENIKSLLWDYATEHGRGAVLWPIRFALTGRAKSPDPFTVASIIGVTESLARIDTACKKLTALTS